MQYILILLFFFISISSLSAKDYLCDLKSSNPKIKWDQINNWEYTEVPFTYPGSIGSYVISINHDNIEINSFKFEDNFYESQKTWSDNYIENLFNDIFYKDRLSKINKTYMSMLIKWMKSNNYDLKEIDGFEKFNGTTSSLHKILRSFSESKKREYHKILFEFNETHWRDTVPKSEFIKLQKSLDKPSSFKEFNKILNHKDLSKTKINSDLILSANESGMKIDIKFRNLYSNTSSLRIDANIKSAVWINGFMFDFSTKSNCMNANYLENENFYSESEKTKKSNGFVKNKLRELKSMLDEGLISQEQYDEKSSKILDEF